MKLDLYTRDLQTGKRECKPFESEEAALAFLENRPKYLEVLGLATEEVPADVNQRLRGAMRPLDEEEKLLERQLDQAADDILRQRAEERTRREADEAAKALAEIATADPSRPLEIRYRYNAALSVATPNDDRPIGDEARDAVMAWVEERNSWVEGRGQIVGEARVTVHPGPLPDGTTERVLSGTFIPVTAPKKDD